MGVTNTLDGVNKIQAFLTGDYTTCDVSEVDGLIICSRDYSNES